MEYKNINISVRTVNINCPFCLKFCTTDLHKTQLGIFEFCNRQRWEGITVLQLCVCVCVCGVELCDILTVQGAYCVTKRAICDILFREWVRTAQ
jgi:hypothetical protein